MSGRGEGGDGGKGGGRVGEGEEGPRMKKAHAE